MSPALQIAGWTAPYIDIFSSFWLMNRVQMTKTCKQFNFSFFIHNLLVVATQSDGDILSECFGVVVANLFSLLHGFLQIGVVSEVRGFLLLHQHEVAADQQTVQQSAFNLCILYGRHHLHEVLGVDVTRLELHLGLYRGVAGLESLPQDFSEGLDEVYFILVDGVPAFFVVVDIENFPVIRLLSSVFLDRGHNLVDEEGYLNVGGIVDVVDQGIKGFSLVLNCSSNKFSYLFEVVASSENYLLLIFQGTSVRLKGIFYQLLGSDSFSVFNSKHLSDESLHRVRDRDVRRESDKSVIDETNQFGNGAFLVGTYSVEHFVEDDPQRPNICSDVVDESFEDLRGHVDG